jgi:prefoldin subunit 5
MDLKAEAGRLQRRVADVGKSREKWRDEAEELRRRVQELEVQTAALQERAAAFKKGSSGSTVRELGTDASCCVLTS